MKHLFFCLFLLLGLCPTRAQTLLQAGDVLLVGYRTQGATDFAFVPLVGLEAGTEVRFTDNGWQPQGGFATTEGTAVYTAPAGGVARGTLISYLAQSGDFTHPGSFQLRADGDQVLVY